MNAAPPRRAGRLSCVGISQRFGSHDVLRDLSLSLEPQEAVAIIGPNGTGKTTLLRILAGLLSPTSGAVHLEGLGRLDRCPRREVAGHLAVVPQARPQVFDFTALELVLMGFHARTRRFALPTRRQRQEALEALSLLEIDDLANRPASVLSGGELQRVLMARTMVADVAFWLLDEPTASLDLKHQLTLLEQVRRHAARGGAVLAILHDLGLVHRFFDRVIVLHDGRIAADGPPATTLTPKVVSQVFGVAMTRGEVDGNIVWVAR